MPGSSGSTKRSGGLCVVVTPPNEGGDPTAIPAPVVDALTHNGATIEHAASVYHAATRLPRALRTSGHDKLALLFVEPHRIPEADTLCLAAQSQFRAIAVWRYSASSGVALAPYSPARPQPAGFEGYTTTLSAPAPTAPLRLVGSAGQPGAPAAHPLETPEAADGGREPRADEPVQVEAEAPLVSQDELSMLLGDPQEGGR